MSTLDIEAIAKLLPHRYPFLLVDRIIELEDMRVVGIKNVTMNEPHFTGHFPGRAVMPGVLIIEALAQVAGVLVLSKIPDREKKLVFLATIEQARFRKPVVPGDQLRLEVNILKLKPSELRSATTPGVRPDGLTERESEVLRLVARGLTNAEVAGHLILSPLTINAHLRSIYGKLGVNTRSAATRYAVDHGLG